MPVTNQRTIQQRGAFSRARGIDMEEMAYQELADFYHEPFVHIQSRRGKRSFDFVIYAKNRTFAIDIFFSDTQTNMVREANKKLFAYQQFGQTVFIVQVNPRLNGGIHALQSQIMNQNIQVMDYEEFFSHVKKHFKPLSRPKLSRDFELDNLRLLERIKAATEK